MSDDEEVLCHKNGLYKHLNDLGYVDFETFESNEQYQLDDIRPKDFGVSMPSKILKDNTSELTPIDSYNHDMIRSLLKSKLLFSEDVNFVESVLSLCSICDEKSIKYTIGAVATSFISIAAYFNKGIDSYLPLSCMAMSSIYAVWKLYKDRSELKRNKSVTLYVKSLQNLCIDFHEVLRFLKEVEILSTGQVSTQNVGSAMYMPLNNVSRLSELPPWKTLPDLRKSVAESLIEGINIFACGCEYISKFSPSWMDIKGFTSNNQVYLESLKETFEDIKTCDGCISIKELQMLNNNYLLIQAEFLKWVAFYLCPVVWKNSIDRFSSFKNEILMKYLKNKQTKICDISVKLKLSFDLQKVFTCQESKQILQKTYLDKVPPSVDVKELEELRVQLHNIFLLVLSTVQKTKSLEDCLVTFSSKITEEKYVPISDLKENLCHQLSIVRKDLARVVQDYDYIYCQVLSKHKTVIHNDTSKVTLNTSHQPQNDDPERIKVGYSDFAVSSPDEVFLAMSGSKPEDFEIDYDEWCSDRKPKIPHTLLTELLSTLNPIKKVFEEREKLVLKKLGIKDIEDEVSENPVLSPLNPTSSTKCKNGRDETQNEGIVTDTDDSSQSEPINSGNSLLMANLLKTNLLTQKRKSLEEEYFSND